MRLTNQQIMVEMPGLRLYTLFCADCGNPNLSEVATLDRVVCSECGCHRVRVIRDVQMEAAAKEKSFQGGSQWSQ